MSSAPQLAQLARLAAGDPQTALVTLLRLACEQLGMERAVLGRISGGTHTIHLSVHVTEGRAPELEGDHPAGTTWCSRVPSDRPLVVRDDAGPALASALDLRCYAGTVVRAVDGRELGVLGVASSTPVTRLDDRDLGVLEALAEVVGELYPALLRPPTSAVPAPRRPTDLGGLADVVTAAPDLEGLTRPLLDALHEMSGIASTYLTVVHEEQDEQEIRFSHNTKDGFALPEGLHVPWGDTLCKRALDEGRACTTDVPAVWGDSEAAAALGIVTYVSVPVRLSDGQVWGTLCGADDVAHSDAADHLPTLSLFARLIAGEVERNAVVDRERARAAQARQDADTDVLTGCTTRRTVALWLFAAQAACTPDEVVALTYVDVNSFKQVNDTLGHATGDAVLAELGTRLRTVARDGDLVARLGGDEFVVAARLPRTAAAGLLRRVRDAGRFRLPDGPEVACATGMATSDDGPDLLGAADVAMYRDKPLPR